MPLPSDIGVPDRVHHDATVFHPHGLERNLLHAEHQLMHVISILSLEPLTTAACHGTCRGPTTEARRICRGYANGKRPQVLSVTGYTFIPRMPVTQRLIFELTLQRIRFQLQAYVDLKQFTRATRRSKQKNIKSPCY